MEDNINKIDEYINVLREGVHEKGKFNVSNISESSSTISSKFNGNTKMEKLLDRILTILDKYLIKEIRVYVWSTLHNNTGFGIDFDQPVTNDQYDKIKSELLYINNSLGLPPGGAVIKTVSKGGLSIDYRNLYTDVSVDTSTIKNSLDKLLCSINSTREYLVPYSSGTTDLELEIKNLIQNIDSASDRVKTILKSI